ncbi:MAG: hypothetical protein QOI21_5565 [Actinomycetota bacterium]|nr:hypothetical protein [Actinomycetota bacterium]
MRTAGTTRQHMGSAGRVANGVNTVSCSYVTPGGHALVSARIYVPEEQLTDTGDRAAPGIPAGVEFRTKPQLAQDILADMTPTRTARPSQTCSPADRSLRPAATAPQAVRVEIPGKIAPHLHDHDGLRRAGIARLQRTHGLAGPGPRSVCNRDVEPSLGTMSPCAALGSVLPQLSDYY